MCNGLLSIPLIYEKKIKWEISITGLHVTVDTKIFQTVLEFNVRCPWWNFDWSRDTYFALNLGHFWSMLCVNVLNNLVADLQLVCIINESKWRCFSLVRCNSEISYKHAGPFHLTPVIFFTVKMKLRYSSVSELNN